MNAAFAIARITFIEQIRNRLYLIIILFGAAVLGSSMLVGALAAQHNVRVIFDLGLVAMELFGLMAAVFGAVTLVIQEIESKTIYLILTRPLQRWVYVLGRFLGLIAAVVSVMLIMMVLHVLVMVLKPDLFRGFVEGWPFWKLYPLVGLLAISEIVITVSLALFF